MTTEPVYDYTIKPRALALGGGWNVMFLEDGEEVGGAVFPLPEHVDVSDPDSVKVYSESLHEDALAEASSWLANR